MKFAEQIPVPASILDDLTALERIKAFYAVPGARGAAAAIGLGLINNTFNGANDADQNLLMTAALGAGAGAYFGRKLHANAAGAMSGMGATQLDNLRAGFNVPIKRAPTGKPEPDWMKAQNEFYNKAGGGAAGVYLRDLGSHNTVVMPGFVAGDRKIAKPVEAPSTATTRGAQPTQVGETAIPTPTTRLALPPARSPIITPPPKSEAPTKLVEEVSNLGPSSSAPKSRWAGALAAEKQVYSGPAKTQYISDQERFNAAVRDVESQMFTKTPDFSRGAPTAAGLRETFDHRPRIAGTVSSGLTPTAIPKKAKLGKNVELTMEDDPMPNEPAGEYGFVNEPVDPMAKPVQKRKKSNLIATPIMGGARRHW